VFTDIDTDTLLKTYATNVRKYHSTMTVTHESSTLQHYNMKRHQLTAARSRLSPAETMGAGTWGQGGQPPTLEKIRVGHAHTLEILIVV